MNMRDYCDKFYTWTKKNKVKEHRYCCSTFQSHHFPPWIALECRLLYLKICFHQLWFASRKYSFIGSTNRTPVCNQQIHNWCWQIFKHNIFILIRTCCMLFYFARSVHSPNMTYSFTTSIYGVHCWYDSFRFNWLTDRLIINCQDNGWSDLSVMDVCSQKCQRPSIMESSTIIQQSAA